MTSHPPRRLRHAARLAARRAVRRVRVGSPRERGDDGFILLESLVAISLIAVVMGALASMTLNVLTGTNELRARQGAAQLATSAMAALGALPASDLLTRRDLTSVEAQLGLATEPVDPWLAAMTPAYDQTPGLAAGSGTTAVVPTVPVPQTLNSIRYEVSTYVGSCVMRSRTVNECVVSGTGTAHLRAVVAVTWSGRGCRVASCTYATATIVNSASDPVFNTNRALPPSRPVVTDPGPQVSTRGASVSVQLTVEAGTGLGAPVWQLTSGTLPVGLTLAANGLVSGTPTATAAATPLTVMVGDAFGRTDTQDFTWRIVEPPSITTPPAQTSTVNQQVSLPVTATCPNAPCRYAVTGAPAGLTIDTTTGVISGRPTTAGTTAVVVTVTDSDDVATSTASFSWRVVPPAAPPTISGVGPVITTIGVATNAALPYTCPTAPCTITLTGSVPGLGLSATNGRTTANGTTSLTVTAASGIVWISGSVAANAVPTGRLQTYPVAVRITDSGAGAATSSGTWTATTTTLVNYALGRNTTQSSIGADGPSGRAVDGNTSGVYSEGSVTHTAGGQPQGWWQVDLGAGSTVRTIVLHNRTDCCADRLAGGQVFLSATDTNGRSYAQLLADPAVTKVPFGSLDTASLALSANDARGRYLRVQLAGGDILSLAEVQVLGPNLASRQTSAQSNVAFDGSPGRAVDDSTDGVYGNGSVTHTEERTSEPWWQVDLGAVAALDAVTVWNRTDCCADRLDGAVLFVSATDMGNRSYTSLRDDPNVGEATFGSTAARTTIAANGFSARYVRVVLRGNNRTLSLAEVQVNGRFP